MSKSLQEKELETLILQFFNQNRAINFATIAAKIGLSRTAKSEKKIPVRFMFPLIQQIAKYGFAIGDYEFWSMHTETEIKKLYAINMNDIVTIEGVEYYEIESLEDVFKLMNNEN